MTAIKSTGMENSGKGLAWRQIFVKTMGVRKEPRDQVQERQKRSLHS